VLIIDSDQPRSTGPPIVALDGWAAGSYLQKAQNSRFFAWLFSPVTLMYRQVMLRFLGPPRLEDGISLAVPCE
jgi:hypothetical protein